MGEWEWKWEWEWWEKRGLRRPKGGALWKPFWGKRIVP